MKKGREYQLIKKYQSSSVRKFKDRKAVFKYLENEVFFLEDFIANVTETARTLNISYIIAYDVITNYLTDILYEIDKNIDTSEEKRKINMYSYFSLIVGFRANLNDNKMYINF